jgi:hypothetical protein
MVISARPGHPGVQALSDLLDAAEVQVEPADAELVQTAFDAWQRFGKGRHPAGLNFGDCFAYSLASRRGDELLFKGLGGRDPFDSLDVIGQPLRRVPGVAETSGRRPAAQGPWRRALRPWPAAGSPRPGGHRPRSGASPRAAGSAATLCPQGTGADRVPILAKAGSQEREAGNEALEGLGGVAAGPGGPAGRRVRAVGLHRQGRQPARRTGAGLSAGRQTATGTLGLGGRLSERFPLVRCRRGTQPRLGLRREPRLSLSGSTRAGAHLRHGDRPRDRRLQRGPLLGCPLCRPPLVSAATGLGASATAGLSATARLPAGWPAAPPAAGISAARTPAGRSAAARLRGGWPSATAAGIPAGWSPRAAARPATGKRRTPSR